jgi:hypothetical protein
MEFRFDVLDNSVKSIGISPPIVVFENAIIASLGLNLERVIQRSNLD